MRPFAVRTLTLAVLHICVYSSAASAVTIDFDGTDESLLSTVTLNGTIYLNSLIPEPTGSQSDNVINVTATAAGKSLGFVAGGYVGNPSDTSAVTGNSVTVSGGTITGSISGGVANGGGRVSGNTVTIAGGSPASPPVITGNIHGGLASGSNVDGNKVDVAGGTVTGDLFGGLVTGDGSVTDNKVNVNGGTINGDLFGGRVHGVGNVRGNTVTVTGGRITGSIYGGLTDGVGNAIDNIITIAGGTITGASVVDSSSKAPIRIYGGWAKGDGNATGNRINITEGNIAGSQLSNTIVGGRADGRGGVSGNSVTVAAAAILGAAATGTASDEFISIIGGLGNTGDVSGNSVIADFDGNDHVATVYGGQSTSGNVSDNTVVLNVTDATINDVRGGVTNTGKATGNLVVINGTGIFGFIEGGRAGSDVSVDGIASDNHVTFNGGAVKGTVSGGVVTHKNTLRGSRVSGNSVTIGDGAIAGSVYGGQILTSGATQDIRNSFVSHNRVTLMNGRVEGDLVGGIVDSQKPMINVKLTDNTVELHGGTLVGGVEGGRALVGGLAVTDGSVDTFTGNRLIVGGAVRGDSGAGIEFVKNFQDIEFRLNRQMLNGHVLLSTINTVDLTPDGKQVRITLTGNRGGGSGLGIGESLTLLDNVTSSNPNIVQGPQTVGRGIAALDVFDLKLIPGGTNGNKQVIATLNQTVSNSRAGNVASGHVSAFLGLSEANTFVATQGMRAFLDTSKGPGHWTVFATGNGGRSKYDNIEMDGGHGLLGLGNSWMSPKGLLSVAVFGDLAKHSYDSQALQLRSSGDSEFAGGGIMSRFRWNNGLYLEAMGRAGRAKFDYATRDFALPTAVAYSEEARYTGAAFGGGVENTYTGGIKMNAYLKYLYNRLEGVNVKLAGDDVRFGEITTQAGLAGIQLSRSFGSVTPYGIAEIERVVNAKTRNLANGLRLENPEDLAGNTYIGTLGVRYNPTSHWGADVKVSGFGGSRRRGYSANLSMEYKF